MDRNTDFYLSLKLSNSDRFAFLKPIFTSHTPAGHAKSMDEVIGFWYADIKNITTQKGAQFKQDFIVNLKNEDRQFISYASKKFINNDDVLLINLFFREYGENGNFYHNGQLWQHHYNSIEDLPDEPGLREAAQKILCSLITRT